MSTRAAKFELLHKSLKKHYKFSEVVTERSVLEHLLYACCLEDAKIEQADEAFAKLQQTYCDWNEVRVTTVIELAEVLGPLPNPTAAGHRIKRCLQSLFELRYQYDIDDMKKANLSKAMEDLQAWKGMTPFVLHYVSQHALGGHSIPADTSILDTLLAADIITPSEAEKKTVPGVERSVPKNKGFEFASLLHQFASDYISNPKSPTALAVFKDLGVTPKPKAVPAPVEAKPKKGATPKVETPASKQADAPETTKPASAKGKEPAKDLAKESSKTLPAKADSAVKPVVAKGATPAAPSKSVSAPAKPAAPAAAASKPAESKGAKAPPAKKDTKPKQEPPKTASKTASAPASPPPAPKPATKSKPAAPAKPVAKPPAKAGKAEPPKAKPAAKSEKPAAKPAATKKPTKMANNVKITKKKPK